MKITDEEKLEGNRLIAQYLDPEVFDYRDSGMKDINGKPILEGSVINANGFVSDIEKETFHCVEFYSGQFGSDVYSDFDPLSSYKNIEVVGHCEDYRELCESGNWWGNLGSVLKDRNHVKNFCDYSQIMDVVEKIESEGYFFTIEGSLVRIYSEEAAENSKNGNVDCIYLSLNETISKVENIWLGCVEFIKWKTDESNTPT